jgi:hypothetical protein
LSRPQCTYTLRRIAADLLKDTDMTTRRLMLIGALGASIAVAVSSAWAQTPPLGGTGVPPGAVLSPLGTPNPPTNPSGALPPQTPIERLDSVTRTPGNLSSGPATSPQTGNAVYPPASMTPYQSTPGGSPSAIAPDVNAPTNPASNVCGCPTGTVGDQPVGALPVCRC